ncbi:hypothetical protein [Microcoleus sp. FACHB-68]|uniref:hypothetical protein n=1 Tax=Microcoleus sp. FACHB-68 TaxID=2692826 RepID=UPI001689A96E|nr:hypothetical protein [Microcoleus sp. FACHB-68]MBD1936651.1 hypothetical protein [Microcoleus sp. FACHB-68]
MRAGFEDALGLPKAGTRPRASSFDPIELEKQIWRLTENHAFCRRTGSFFPGLVLNGDWTQKRTEVRKINSRRVASPEKSGLFSNEKPTAANKF